MIDVAPVTEDLSLAADWSVIFPPDASGVNAALVAHIDFQVTTSIEALGRCIETLSKDAITSLQQALEAYDTGLYDVFLGGYASFGHHAVRNRPEWQELQVELQGLVDALAISVRVSRG